MNVATHVPTEATRVTGRRVVQYILDGILISVLVYLAWWGADELFPQAGFELQNDRGRSSWLIATAGGWWNPVAVTVGPLAGLLVFALIPMAIGRTPAMALLDLRIVRTDGGPVSNGQHVVRTVLLVVDGFLAGLVGLIVMVNSEHRQRIGDHVAGTLVVRGS